MGRNLDLCDMLGAPDRLVCRKCGKIACTGFDDYDVDCRGPEEPGKWDLLFCCSQCEHAEIWAVQPGKQNWAESGSPSVETLAVEFTEKQRTWLRTLASDFRGSFSEAVQCCVNDHIEAHEKDPMNPARHNVKKAFAHCLQRFDWPDAYKLLSDLRVMLAEAELKESQRRPGT
jgi:hypothetical protein